jgi:mannose-6-phosphate isomerase-like protein (cupin superfamily)
MSTAGEQTGWKTARVNDIPPVKPDWPATWKSVRHHFGITAFGVNAVTKDAGNVLIPEHDESSSRQHELYFVHVGEVSATLDGEAVTIPAGGMVSVGPGVTRKIEATASPTTLFVVGATPGEAYEIGDWEK